MSDFLISVGLNIGLENYADQMRWAPGYRFWTGQNGALRWLVGHLDRPDLWAPAWDPISQTRALVAGRFAFSEAEWSHSEGLPFDGGLAARLVLDSWLSRGASGPSSLNGAGLAVVLDERLGHLHIWTDRMGIYPAFRSTGTVEVLGSHPDVIARVLGDAGSAPRFDAITMAEFLATGTATHPHTYWSGITHLEPASHYRIRPRGGGVASDRQSYWLPRYFSKPYLTDRTEIVDRLEAALTEAVRKRTLDRLGKVAVLLSSGADSRAALFATRKPPEVTCVTLYDEPNPELAGAQALARAAQAKHLALARDEEYYFTHAQEAVRVSGGMWSIESAHFGGLPAALQEENPGVVLSGCYADYLLKGIAYNRSHRRLLGRPIPLVELSDYQHCWHHAHFLLSQRWAKDVESRLDRRYRPLSPSDVHPQSATEYLRLSPLVREPDAAGRLFLRRNVNLDVFMSDNDILELFGSISPSEKVNGIPFGMAVQRICGQRAHSIANSNYSSPVGADEGERVINFIWSSLKRKVGAAARGSGYRANPASIATSGSWPNFSRASAQSQILRRWFSSRSGPEEELLSSMLGEVRRNRSLEEWAREESTLLLRYYTASLWLSANPQAMS